MDASVRNNIIVGDNLDVLASIDDGIIDLIYIDPPFFTQEDFDSFDDRWASIGEYITFLEARVQEMYRVLKENGSLYVHCDCHASHYIKVMLDDVFNGGFINEIIWCFRGAGRGRYFARKHETIFFYAKGKDYTFNDEFARVPYSESYGGGAYYYSKNKSAMPRSLKAGINHWTPDERGKIMEDYWLDIPTLGSQSPSRNGYPTQKPEELAERIIQVSSNEGDLVADFFCGSGTTLAVAKRLGRDYFGVDINPDAVKMTKDRLRGIVTPL
jgi:site-specific DNA-methyltransferase (adenine-specific)